MNMLTSENAFLSTLQPDTPSTTYALPSENQLGNGSALSAEAARSRRVQEQIKMKLAEKSTLPRQNGGTSHYAMSDYGGSSAMTYSTNNPGYSSKSSYMYSKTWDPRISNKKEYTSRSAAPNIAQFQRMSVGAGGGGGFYREDMRSGGFQGSIRQNRMDQDAMSVHSMRAVPAVNAWVMDNSDAGSMISERDATFGRQYTQNAMNGYSTQMKQGGGPVSYQTEVEAPGLFTTRRTLSGTLARGAMLGGGAEMIQQQQSFKGPAHRTISRITNRNRMSVGSMSGTQMTSSAGNLGAGGDVVDRGFVMSTLGSQGNVFLPRQGSLARSMSIRSMQSVGGGMDIYGLTDMDGMDHLDRVAGMDMKTAVDYLTNDDHEGHIMATAFIQHQCYHDKQSKDELRSHHVIPNLVRLFNSDNQEVRRFSTGAMRNAIFENTENKKVLVSEGGIDELIKALDHADDDLYKNITGILWNLSARETLKETLAKDTLSQLTDKVISPITQREHIAASKGSDFQEESASQTEIFCNATGFLRNLSSGNEKTRDRMRNTKKLVDSLVSYISDAISMGKAEEKAVENCVCVLRNLSFQIYQELPPSYSMYMNKPGKADQSLQNIGCFTSKSQKAKKEMECNKRFVFSNSVKTPTEIEWLWNPKIVDLYEKILKACEINATTREAATGAMQNITVGDTRWPISLCFYIVKMAKVLPTLLDLLHTDRNSELRSLTGLLRNISRHVEIPVAVNPIVKKLPKNGEDSPSADVVINICGILNNMVMNSYDSAKNITENSGLEKLMAIKNASENEFSSDLLKKGKAAGTVLANMYNYKKLHREFKQKGFLSHDFITPKIQS